MHSSKYSIFWKKEVGRYKRAVLLAVIKSVPTTVYGSSLLNPQTDTSLWTISEGTEAQRMCVCVFMCKKNSVYCLVNLWIQFLAWQWDGTLGRWTYSSQIDFDEWDEDENKTYPLGHGLRHLRRSRRIALQRERQQKSQDALEPKHTTSCWLAWLMRQVSLIEDKSLLINRMMWYLRDSVNMDMRVVMLLLLPVLKDYS